MIVRVYLNEADGSFVFGFRPEEAILREALAMEQDLDFTPTGGMFTKAYLEDIYDQLNIGGELIAATDWTKSYRERANRSLTVGDVVVLDNDQAYAVDREGFVEVFFTDVSVAAARYNPEADDRKTALAYVWTADDYIDVDATIALRKVTA